MEAKLQLEGVYEYELVRGGKVIDRWTEKNLITTEGQNHMLNSVLNAATQITAWAIGLFSDNYSPLPTDTAASPGFTEFTGYGEATRQAYVPATAGSTAGSITNGSGAGATKAVFTMNTGGTLYGSFMSSDSAKSSVSGTLFSSSRFTSSRTVVATDILNVTYTVQSASA